MKMLLSTLLITTLFSTISTAQEQEKETFSRNASFLEVGGPGLFFSINYERQLTKTPGLSWRIGLGGYAEYDFYVTYSTGLAYLFDLNKEKTAFLQLGVNYTIAREYIGISSESRNADLFENLVPGLSYRKHFENDFLFKAGLNAVMNDSGLIPWLNVGVGKRF